MPPEMPPEAEEQLDDDQGMPAAHLWRPDRAVTGVVPPLPACAARMVGLRELMGLLGRRGSS